MGLLSRYHHLFPKFHTQAGGPPAHVLAALKKQLTAKANAPIVSPLLNPSSDEAASLPSSPTSLTSPKRSSSTDDGDDIEKQSLLNSNNNTNNPSSDSALSLRTNAADEIREVWSIWCNNTDSCGLFCAGFTWFLLLWPNYILYTRILTPWESLWVDYHGWMYFGIYQLLCGLALWSHTKAMLTDPGSIPYGCLPIVPPPETGLYPSCHNCAYNYKPDRAHHCSICKRCISKMDHHCPWVNNCVGVGNLKFFIQFCLYTCLTCVFTFSMILSRILSCPASNISICFDKAILMPDHQLGNTPNYRYNEDSAWSFVMIVLVIMECFIFGLFTLAMSISQAQAVSADETQIESWQKQRDARKPPPLKPSTKPRLPLIHPLAPVGATGVLGSGVGTDSSSSSLSAHGSVSSVSTESVVGTTTTSAAAVNLPMPLLASNSNTAANAAAAAASGQVSISLPVAHPLPPSTTTRARNCRVVFVGSGSTVAAHAQSTNQVFGWLNAARWRAALLPPVVGGTNAAPNRGLFLEWVLTVILFVPGLVLSLFTGNVIRFLLPLDVTHDDYDRLKGYRLPAPGVQTIIDVIDPATRIPPPQQPLQQPSYPPPQQYVQNPYATQGTYQGSSSALPSSVPAPTLSVPQRAAADLELHPLRNSSTSRARVDAEEVTIGSEDDGFAK